MTKRLILLVLIAALTAMLLPGLAASDSYRTMYVYTDNGKSLNVRSDPSTGNNKIGSLQFGEEVTVVEFKPKGWAQILWGQSYYGEFGVAYVQSRFLVNSRPGIRPPQPTAAPASDVTDYARIFTSMNAEFRSARQTNVPYTVVARPSRASGWVNLRWAPSTEAERIATCNQGKELTVLAELKNWYQVEDPETGMIGFINRSYVTRK